MLKRKLGDEFDDDKENIYPTSAAGGIGTGCHEIMKKSKLDLLTITNDARGRLVSSTPVLDDNTHDESDNSKDGKYFMLIDKNDQK